MKKAFIAEGALNLAQGCSAGTGDAEKAEPVAMWQRNSDTEEIEFAVIGDPYVVNGTKLYTEQQLNELICQLSTAKSLSVTNIIINVVPGEDGMGKEVYAKSVEDVERLIASLSERTEASLDAERTWETMMMKAIGEDGPGSVATAIGLLKQQRDELVAALTEAAGFIRSLTEAGGPYPYINGTGLVVDAYHYAGKAEAAAKLGAGNTQHPVSTD